MAKNPNLFCKLPRAGNFRCKKYWKPWTESSTFAKNWENGAKNLGKWPRALAI